LGCFEVWDWLGGDEVGGLAGGGAAGVYAGGGEALAFGGVGRGGHAADGAACCACCELRPVVVRACVLGDELAVISMFWHSKGSVRRVKTTAFYEAFIVVAF
jgi:hypothetical protein